MLGEHPITPFCWPPTSPQPGNSNRGKPGLQIERENQNIIVFRCGNSTHLDMAKSTTGTADRQTQAAWQISGIRAEIAGLRTHAIKVEGFDTRGQRPKFWRASRAGLAKLLARRSTSPLRSGSVKGRYSGTGGDTGV